MCGVSKGHCIQGHVLLGTGTKSQALIILPKLPKIYCITAPSQLCGDLTLNIFPLAWWGGDSQMEKAVCRSHRSHSHLPPRSREPGDPGCEFIHLFINRFSHLLVCVFCISAVIYLTGLRILLQRVRVRGRMTLSQSESLIKPHHPTTPTPAPRQHRPALRIDSHLTEGR